MLFTETQLKGAFIIDLEKDQTLEAFLLVLSVRRNLKLRFKVSCCAMQPVFQL